MFRKINELCVEIVPNLRVGSISKGGAEDIRRSDKHENLHFDDEKGFHMSSKSYKTNGCTLGLDLLTILYQSRISQPMRSGLVKILTIQDPSTSSGVEKNLCMIVVHSCTKSILTASLSLA